MSSTRLMTERTTIECHEILSRLKELWMTIGEFFIRHKAMGRYALKAVLAAMGMLPIFMYVGPGADCAAREDCGAWLANLITVHGAQIYFTLMGFNFGAVNAYLASESIDVLLKFLKEQKSGRKVALIIIALSVYLASQSIPPIFASISTDATFWETILVDCGNAPAAVYTGVNLLRLGSVKTKKLLDFIRRKLGDFFSSLQDEQYLVAKWHHTQKQQLIRRLAPKLVFLKRHPDKLLRGLAEERLYDAWLSTKKDKETHPWLMKAVRGIGWIFGAALSLSFTSMFFKNALEGIDSFLTFLVSSTDVTKNLFECVNHTLPFEGLKIIMAALLLSSGAWSAGKILGMGFAESLTIFLDVLRGKSIQSIFFQNNPLLCLATLFTASGMAALSYPLVHTLVVHELGGVMNEMEKVLLYSADAGMDLYHFIGLMCLANVLFHTFSRAECVVEITKMEQRLQHFKDMSASEFKDFVEKNTTHTNEILGLEPRSTDTETGITNQRTPRARLENSQYVGLQHRFFSTSIPAVNGQAAPQNPPPSRRFGLNLPITLI